MLRADLRSSPLVIRPSASPSAVSSPFAFFSELKVTMYRSFCALIIVEVCLMLSGPFSSLPAAHQSVMTMPPKPNWPRRIVVKRSYWEAVHDPFTDP